MSIPVIDERVRYVGPTALRDLNAKALRDLTDLIVVQVDEKPVAVIVPMAIYMEIQKAFWPSSLVPSLGEFVETVIFADEDRQRLGCKCVEGNIDPDCPLENHRGRVNGKTS